MNNRQRFIRLMNYQHVDRVPYFEEGIRSDTLKKWGISRKTFEKRFKVDFREELIPELDPIPKFRKWPSRLNELSELESRLNPNSKQRFPDDFNGKIQIWKNREFPLILRVHRGFFLSMGVYDNTRFIEVLQLLMEKPEFVKNYLKIQGEFAASMSQSILNQISVDAVFFSEPIGSNFGSLISPEMYEEFVLESYKPLLNLCNKHDINTKIFLTYANTSALIPSILKYGINCLWACEVDCREMDYLLLREMYGKNLRLIGGIDLDTLLQDKPAIKKEIIRKVPELIEQGGYIPIADGRVRSNVKFENYVYYRNLIADIIQNN